MNLVNMVVVAHADDEISFMAAIRALRNYGQEVHLVVVTDGDDAGRKKERLKELAKSCKELAISRWKNLEVPDIYSARLSLQEVRDKLRQFKEENYDDSYNINLWTHGTWEFHWHHQDVAIAALQVFHNASTFVRMPLNGVADRIYQIDVQEKANTLYRVYAREVEEDNYKLKDITSVEMYRRSTLEEQLRWLSYDHVYLPGLDVEDPWGFERSEYERQRFHSMRNMVKSLKPTSVLEVGACEGKFTEYLVELGIQGKHLITVEKNPVWFNSLHGNVPLATSYAMDALTAVAKFSHGVDLTIASEMLYYNDNWTDIVRGIKSKYFLSCNYSEFAHILNKYGQSSLKWELLETTEVPQRGIEFLSGLPIKRGPATIMLWRTR